MKVTYISAYSSVPSKSANSYHVMKMCDAYENIGVKTRLLVSNNEDQTLLKGENVFDFYFVDNQFEIKKVGVNFYSKWRKIYSLVIKFPLVAFLKDFDFCHSRTLITSYVLAKYFKKDLVFELHDAVWENPKSKKILLELISSKSLKFVIVITNALKDDLCQISDIKKPVLVLPDGVGEKSINLKINKDYARQKLGLSLVDYIVVYSGQLYKGRGIELIINLAKHLKTISFLIVGGNQTDIDRYARLAVNLTNIQFLGHQNQKKLQYYLLSADALLMPYEQKVSVAGDNTSDTSKYASPLKMFEYMATGRPIISSTLPVLTEILEDQKNCLMVPYDDTIGWVKAIQALIENPSLAEKLASKAKEDVKQYTWEKRTKKIIDFYKALHESR